MYGGDIRDAETTNKQRDGDTIKIRSKHVNVTIGLHHVNHRIPSLWFTGGSRGLGRNTALHLAIKGVDVILTYRSRQAEAAEIVQEITALGRRAVALQLDVADSSSFAAFSGKVKEVLKDQFSREQFDYLVNNAGAGIHANFMDTTEAQFDEMVNVHLKSTFFLSQKLLPLMWMVDGSSIYLLA